MNFRFVLLSLLVSQNVMAAEGHGHGVPGMLVFWQFFNLIVLFAGLIYFIGQPVKEYFLERRAAYLAAAQKSQAARAEAETRFQDLQLKIQDMDRTRAESLARAEAEASDLKKQMIVAANETAARIRKEAETTSRLELARARRELHEKFAQDAVVAARTVLTKDLSAQDQARLQGDFVKHIEEVHP